MEPNPYEASKELNDDGQASRNLRMSRAGFILIVLMVCGTSLVVLDVLFMRHLATRGRGVHGARQTALPSEDNRP